MYDREITLCTAFSVTLWVTGVALVLADLATHVTIGQVGLVSIGGAMVLNVRTYIIDMRKHMIDAFEMGRDYERDGEPENVRSIR